MLLGAQTVAGRTFSLREDRPGAPRVVVLTQAFWTEHFGGDVSAIGKSLSLDGEQHEIVGVISADTRLPGFDADVWIPLRPRLAGIESVAGAKMLRVLIRTAADAQPDAVTARLSSLAGAVAENAEWAAHLTPLQDHLTGALRPALLLLLGASLAVLLIACANAADLLLSRVPERTRELAVRSAMGAPRARLLRQILLESAFLTATALTLALVPASWLHGSVLLLAPENFPRSLSYTPDARMFAFVVAAAAATVLAVGLLPACPRSASASRSEQHRVTSSERCCTRACSWPSAGAPSGRSCSGPPPMRSARCSSE